jgi:Flp pilus assembly pilin Flp
LPHRVFFRRRGEFAFQLIGVDGTRFDAVERYVQDVRGQPAGGLLRVARRAALADPQRGVAAGSLALKAAMKSMPRLGRVGGACPCKNSVRWVMAVDTTVSGGPSGPGPVARPNLGRASTAGRRSGRMPPSKAVAGMDALDTAVGMALLFAAVAMATRLVHNAILRRSRTDGFLRDDAGQSLVEYGLIIAVIAISVIIAMVFLRDQISNIVSDIGNNLT